MDHAQSQSGPLALRFGTEERLEDALERVGGDACARVGDGEQGALAGLLLRAGLGGRDPGMAGLDHNLAAGTRRVARVEHEVQDDLLEGPARAAHGRRVSADSHVDAGAGPDRRPQQAGDVADELAQVDRLELHHLASAEREQVSRQRRRALRRVENLVLERTGLFGQPLDAECELRIADDDHQQVVEVVREPPGQLSDGFHSLRGDRIALAPPQFFGSLGHRSLEVLLMRGELALDSAPLLDLARHLR